MMCMVYFALALAVVHVVMAMVPRCGEGSNSFFFLAPFYCFAQGWDRVGLSQWTAQRAQQENLKSRAKVQRRNPWCALTSQGVDLDRWGRLEVGQAGVQGGAEPPHRWPARLLTKTAGKPRRRACRRGRGWLTTG